jgi:hypothetical protein
MTRLLAALVLYLASFAAAGAVVSLHDSFSAADPNQVFLHEFELSAAGDISVKSWGYGGGVNAAGELIPAGGFDPLLSVFSGSGDGAVFLDSNYDELCATCHDATFTLTALAAGSYTLALTVPANISFAENYGGGTLADGFTQFGQYYDIDSGTERLPHFAVDLSGTTLVPEPGTHTLMTAGVLLLLALARRRRIV